jgi:Retroviral aspartyl protease
MSRMSTRLKGRAQRRWAEDPGSIDRAPLPVTENLGESSLASEPGSFPQVAASDQISQVSTPAEVDPEYVRSRRSEVIRTTLEHLAAEGVASSSAAITSQVPSQAASSDLSSGVIPSHTLSSDPSSSALLISSDAARVESRVERIESRLDDIMSAIRSRASSRSSRSRRSTRTENVSNQSQGASRRVANPAVPAEGTMDHSQSGLRRQDAVADLSSAVAAQADLNPRQGAVESNNIDAAVPAVSDNIQEIREEVTNMELESSLSNQSREAALPTPPSFAGPELNEEQEALEAMEREAALRRMQIYDQAIQALLEPRMNNERIAEYQRRVDAAIRTLREPRRADEEDPTYHHRRMLWSRFGSAYRAQQAPGGRVRGAGGDDPSDSSSSSAPTNEPERSRNDRQSRRPSHQDDSRRASTAPSRNPLGGSGGPPGPPPSSSSSSSSSSSITSQPDTSSSSGESTAQFTHGTPAETVPTRSSNPPVTSSSRARFDSEGGTFEIDPGVVNEGPDPMTQQSATQRRTTKYFRRDDSTPQRSNMGYVPPVTQNSEPAYVLANRKIIRTIIRENVGQGTPLEGQAADVLKRIKIDSPSKYDGKDNADLFDSWILNLVRWMRMQNLVGPARDKERLLVLGFYLEGDAHTWFDDIVAAPDRTTREWTFEDAVLQLHKRFISRVAAIRASERFFRCTYHSADGVVGLYNRLNRCARRMVQHPGDYAIRQQFLKALPDEIRTPLIRFRSITAETATLTHLRDHAIQVEENNRIAVQLGMSPMVSSTPKRGAAEGNRPERDRAMEQRNERQDRWRDRREGREERRERRRERNVSRPEAKRFRPEARPEERPREARDIQPRQNGPRRPRPAGNTADVDKSHIECFACHKMGHYASDPICEKYGERVNRPRVTAMAIGDTSTSTGSERHDRPDSSDEMSFQSEKRSHISTSSSNTKSTRSRTSERSITPTERPQSAYSSVHDLDRYDWSSATPSYYSDEESFDSRYSSEDSEGTVQLARIQVDVEGSLAPMTVDLSAQKAKVPYKGEGKDPNLYDSNLRRKDSHDQPSRSPEGQRVITAIVMINGAPAWTMFDTGSTADCVSPEFARVNNCQTFDLESPVPLQLGTKGSKSTIVYGTNVEITPVSSLRTIEYMDIINIDRYDAILGMPYMAKHGIMINLRSRTVHFADGSVIKALESEDEARYKGRSSKPAQREPLESMKGVPKRNDRENRLPEAAKENVGAARGRDKDSSNLRGRRKQSPEVLKVAGTRIPGKTVMATRGETSTQAKPHRPPGKPREH